MEPTKLDQALNSAIEAAEASKPNDRSERDRWTQIIITKLQEVKALGAYYGVGDGPVPLNEPLAPPAAALEGAQSVAPDPDFASKGGTE